MTKYLEKRRVIEFRKQGKSYSEIKKLVNVSKGSLSLWLRNVPLSDKQILGLKKKKEAAVERYRETMRLKREKKYKKYYENQKRKWLPLSQREEFMAGLFLYWGEGGKASRNTVSINNTDPSVVKFALYWITHSLKVPTGKVKVQVHLYNDMDVDKELEFWSMELGISRKQFVRPYIKETKRANIDQKGFGHGTCGLLVHNTVLKENVLMALKAISDAYTRNTPEFGIIDRLGPVVQR